MLPQVGRNFGRLLQKPHGYGRILDAGIGAVLHEAQLDPPRGMLGEPRIEQLQPFRVRNVQTAAGFRDGRPLGLQHGYPSTDASERLKQSRSSFFWPSITMPMRQCVMVWQSSRGLPLA